jgi:hypothetical protein
LQPRTVSIILHAFSPVHFSQSSTVLLDMGAGRRGSTAGLEKAGTAREKTAIRVANFIFVIGWM